MMSDELQRRLRENAPRYFPDLASAGELRVEEIDARIGPLSSIQRFRIAAADVEHRVVVKRPPAATGMRRRDRRPRVAPLLEPAAKLRMERDALVALAGHLETAGDPRLGAVHVLDGADERFLVMREMPGRSLASLLARAHRLWQPLGSRGLDETFERVGAWLRALHALPPLAHTRPRMQTRRAFATSVRELAGYLASARSDRCLARAIARIETLADAWLPDSLPLATSHGDLAPRNVIVDPAGRVALLDTRAAWSAPIYEDLGYFLTALKTPRAQAASLGLAFGDAALRRFERAFLAGYFGDAAVPLERIRLFELQALLDKWAAQTAGRAPSRALVASYRQWSADRLIERSIADRLAELERCEVAA